MEMSHTLFESADPSYFLVMEAARNERLARFEQAFTIGCVPLIRIVGKRHYVYCSCGSMSDISRKRRSQIVNWLRSMRAVDNAFLEHVQQRTAALGART